MTAADMARSAGIQPKRLRHVLRAAKLGWHRHNERWEVIEDDDRHTDMKRVLATLKDMGP